MHARAALTSLFLALGVAVSAAAQVLPGQAVPEGADFAPPPASSAFADMMRPPLPARTVTFGRASAPAAPAATPLPQPTAIGTAEPAAMLADAEPRASAGIPADPSPESVRPGPTRQASLPDGSPALPAPGTRLTGRPRAVDGATLAFGNRQVRLSGGLAVPEPGRSCHLAPVSWPCGDASRRMLDRLLSGLPVICVVVGAEGSLPVAACRVGRDDLSAAMVESGMAKSADPALREAAGRARADRRGLWAGERR